MAVDIDALAVQLTADVKNFEKEFARANGISDKTFKYLERRAKKAEKDLDATLNRIGAKFKGTFAVVGAALGANEVAKFSDSWTRLNNLMAAASQATGVQARSLSSLREGADDARTSIESYADLYVRLMRSTEGVAQNEEEIARATNIVSKALAAGGASAQEASGAMLQLGQALTSGVLQGDELRSLRENAPIIAKAIADEFGVTIGELKKLGADGQLTADRVFKGILKAQQPVEAQFAKTNATIADGITRIKNAMTEFIGIGGETTGIAASIAAGLRMIADNFDVVAKAGAILASLIAAQLLGRSIIPLIARLKDAGVAIGGVLKALQSARNFSGILAALGGPITVGFAAAGIAAGALTIAVTSYQNSAREARDRTARLNEEMYSLGLISKEAAGKIAEVATAANSINVDDKNAQKIRDLQKEYLKLRWGTGGLFGSGEADEIPSLIKNAPTDFGPKEGEAQKGAENIKQTLKDLYAQTISTEDAIKRIGQAKGFDEANEKLQKYATTVGYTLERMKGLEHIGAEAGENIKLGPIYEDIDRIVDRVKNVLEADGRPLTAEKLEDIRSGLRQGGSAAQETKVAIDKLINGTHEENALSASLDRVLGKLNQIKDVSGTINKTMSNASWADFFKPVADKVNQGVDLYKQYQAGEEYVKTQEQLNARTKQQIDYETRLGKLRKDNAEAGRILTPEQENRIIQSQIEGDERRSNEGKTPKTPKAPKAEKDNEFDSLTKSLQERTAALKEEAGIVASLNPMIDDYGYALEKAKQKRDLLAAAQKAGFTEENMPVAEIERLAEAYAQAEVEVAKVTEQQDKMRDSLQAVKEASQDVTRTFIDSMINGKSATEALGDALMRLGQRLLDSGLNSVFDSIFSGLSGGGGGGIFGSIFGALFGGAGKKADGGEIKMNPNGMIRGKGGPRSDSIPTMLSNGEYVVNAAATKRNRALLEKINGGWQHRADGGIVGGYSAKSLPQLPAMRQMPSLTGIAANRNDVNVNAHVKTSVDQNGDLQAYVESVTTTKVAKANAELLQSRSLRQVVNNGVASYSANPRGAVL